MDSYFPNFANDKENNILIYILIFINKIFLSLKIQIFRRVKSVCHFSTTNQNQRESLSRQNIFLGEKYESTENLIIEEIKDDNSDIKDNQIKKRKYNINKNKNNKNKWRNNE